MKAAVYNRWLHQKGGGERHSAMAAQVLSERFETELVTHRPISCEELSDALNIDLSNVTVRVIPALPPNRFAAFTREFDLFVNSSFMTNQPSEAAHSMMLVLFPSPIDRSRGARIRQAVGRFLTRELLLPEWLDGFYDVQGGFATPLGKQISGFESLRLLELPPLRSLEETFERMWNFRSDVSLMVRLLLNAPFLLILAVLKLGRSISIRVVCTGTPSS